MKDVLVDTTLSTHPQRLVYFGCKLSRFALKNARIDIQTSDNWIRDG